MLSPRKREYSEMESMKPKRAKWYTVKIQYSPEKEDDAEPILILKHFSAFPHVAFDKVTVGKSKTCSLRVMNPLQEIQQVHIEKFPYNKGFSVSSTDFVIEAGKQLSLNITWTPTEAISCREIALFRTSTGCKTQAYLIGSALSPVKKKNSRRNTYSFRKNLGDGKKVLTKTEIRRSCNDDNKENLAIGKLFQKTLPEMKNVLSCTPPAVFALKQDDSVFTESPIRRQTYIINKMFADAAMSDDTRCIRQEMLVPCSENSMSPKRSTFVFNGTEETTNNCAFSTSQTITISGTSGMLGHKDLDPVSETNASDEDCVLVSETNAFDKDNVSVSVTNISDKGVVVESGNSMFYKDGVTVSSTVSLQPAESQSIHQVTSQDISHWICSQMSPISETLEATKTIIPDLKLPEKENSNDTSLDTTLESGVKVESRSEAGDSNVMIPDSSLSDAQERLLLSACISDFIQEYHDSGQENECSLEVELSILQDSSMEINISPFTHRVDGAADANNHASVLNSPSPCTINNLVESNVLSTEYEVQRCSTGIMSNVPDMTIPSHFLEDTDECISKLDNKENKFFEEIVNEQSQEVHIEGDICCVADCTKGVSFDIGHSIAPDTKEPIAPDTKEPIAPDTKEHITPDTKEPIAPDTKESIAPDTKELSASNIEEPIASDIKEPIAADIEEPIASDIKQPAAFDIEPSTAACFKQPFSVTKSASKNEALKHAAMRRRCQSAGAKDSPALKEASKHVLKKKTPKPPVFKTPSSLIRNRNKLTITKPDSAKTTPTKDSSKTENSAKRIPVVRKRVKVCPKRLHLVKTPIVSAEETIRHPNIFAARNMYYDERWMEKQENAFTRWLNFILTPPEELKTPDQDSKVDGAKLWVESMKGNALVRAPTKEDMSLRIYTAIRMMNHLRFASCKLYQSEQVTSVIKRLEKEIELKRLLVRKERQMHADVGIKQHVLGLLLSYNPLWLRIGLETIYGEFIPMQSNQDIHGLSCFIIKRFLNNPDIAAKYAHPTVPHSFKQGFEEEMKKFMLKKFLLLVYYLDVAKTKRLINHDPCLFCKGSEFKASRDLLLVFSREYLSGEGDVTRHLKQFNYVVSHQQTALDEFDYAVTNIAVDLRCGLRLARVMELLFQDWSLCTSLRIPTISRLQKIHNNDVVMKTFIDAGHQIDGDITSRDLVNGHREKTLDFLWQIIFKTQISRLVDIKKLKSEIFYLKRNLKLKADVAAFNALRMPVHESESYQTNFTCSKQYSENECIRLLFLWCQVVCGHYDLKVLNFTVSFSDGRALCYLLHHYHPHILPLEAVKQKTSTGYFEQKESHEFDESYFESFDNPFKNNHTLVDMEQLVKNEKENLKLVFEKLKDIGGVPIVTQPSDMSNTIPDEKVVITLVAYLNIRLMDLSQEIRAARVIQLAWRNRHLNKRREQLQIEIKAVIVIQRMVRKFLERRRLQRMQRASIVIQSSWRMHKAKKEARALRYRKHMNYLSSKAVVIQAAYRGHFARQRLKKMNASAIIIQSHLRCWVLRSKFLALKKSAIVLQRHYRAMKLGAKQREDYLHVKQSVILLQACSRRWLAKQAYKRRKLAVLKLQAWCRQLQCRHQYLKARKSVIAIQQRYRSKLLMRKCRKEFQGCRSAVLQIQHWYRCCHLRKRENHAAIIIQAYFRKCVVQKQYFETRNAILTIQRKWKATIRSRREREHFLEAKKLREDRTKALEAITRMAFLNLQAIRIQRFYRDFKVQKLAQKQLQSAIVIQHWFRGRRVRLWFSRLKKNTCLFQAAARALLEKKRQAAACIQSYVRSWLLRKHLKKQQIAATKIQRWFRGVRTRLWFLRLRKSVCLLQAASRTHLLRRHMASVCIQSHVRSWLVRRRIQQRHVAATRIQVWFRSMKTRLWFLHLQKSICPFQAAARTYIRQKICAVICIQSYTRSWLVRQQLRKEHIAATKLQRWCREMKTRLWFLRFRRQICVFQAALRAYLVKKLKAIICIQSHVRSWLVRRRMEKQRISAIKIQAIWRAYKVRCIRNKHIAAARKRIKQVTASASPDQTLASRTATALDYLLKYRTMYQLLCALTNLDVSTRLSPVCCEQLAESDGIEVIIQLIKSCNRSVPHMEVIKLSVNVLLNVSKYEKTVKAVWEASESVEVIIDIMRIFREKGCVIFTKCCSLLWILCQEPHRCDTIKEEKVITEQIVSLHYLVMRKKKIEDKHLVRKIKMAESLSTSFLHSTLAPKPKRSLQIQPDWILGDKVMREFADPVTAISAVMKVLGLKEK